jgi:predicted GNAT superfamily acetyltransferase
MASDITNKASQALTDFAVRDCVSLDDFAACVSMQREVWQFADLDITPVRSFVITRQSGGRTTGAFDAAGRLLGFSHMIPAWDDRLRPYYYSHMLAVAPGTRDAGVGAALKLAQRRRAIERGVPLIVWTFDPLQSRNAHLNLVKLGGVVRNYYANYYGNESTSALHRGLDTDRLFVEWWVGSTRVKEAVEGGGVRRPDTAVAAVEVPFDIEEVKARDMAEAREWQAKIRAAFQQHLAAGLYCAGFERGRQSEPSRYLFFADTREEIPYE